MRGRAGRPVTDSPPAPVDPVTDAHVTAAQAGEEDAFVVLFRHVHPGLVRYLAVLCGDDAEDVAAETWTLVCRDLHQFSGGLDNFRGWVMTIGRHRGIDHRRRQRRRPVGLVPPEDLPVLADDRDPASIAEEGMSTAAAVRLIAELPRHQAEAVMLRAVLGLDVASAAAVLGKRPGAVRTATHRGLRELARRLEAAGDGPERHRSARRGRAMGSAPPESPVVSEAT
ncbi:MAG: RNA polymerase sigma factor [Actinomycetales bacterium]|nr:RNA polymerase sigma factor [Actinomycetales bacterium]